MPTDSLDVRFAGESAGTLRRLPAGELAFSYAPAWQKKSHAFPYAPRLPLGEESVGQAVMYFFENLLPRGIARERLEKAVGSSDIIEILALAGGDTTGALTLVAPHEQAISPCTLTASQVDRHLAEGEVLPILHGACAPGSRPLLAVREAVDGAGFSLPSAEAPSDLYLARYPDSSCVTRECFARTLASCLGLRVVQAHRAALSQTLIAIPRPDRPRGASRGHHRFHLVDACQLLGVGPAMRGDLVSDAGLGYAQIFAAAALTRVPAATRENLLRWVALNFVFGHTAASASDVHFEMSAQGLVLAPFNRMPIAEGERFELRLGNARFPQQIGSADFARFADECNLARALVADEFEFLRESWERAREEALEMMDPLPVDREALASWSFGAWKRLSLLAEAAGEIKQKGRARPQAPAPTTAAT